MTPALRQGEIIEVYGFVMLAKLEPGRYRIKRVGSIYGISTYTFARPKGIKAVIVHYSANVDPWLRANDDPDLNKIVRVGPARPKVDCG
jgi:hypothetical protein